MVYFQIVIHFLFVIAASRYLKEDILTILVLMFRTIPSFLAGEFRLDTSEIPFKFVDTLTPHN